MRPEPIILAAVVALLLAATPALANEKPLTSRPNSQGGMTWSDGVRSRPNSQHGETYFIPGGRTIQCRPNSMHGETCH